ncbi:sialin-like isoform X2 [Macrobrachium nipponense]|uniref:sialin-like isoform X2 n=1 Tax=Macrobrachium nipponense TaxID=159736 RepID=UPI0030C7C74B
MFELFRDNQSAVDEFLRNRTRWLPTRISLAIMAWFGFVNLYMVRINLSVAIVVMVRRNTTSGAAVACESPFGENVSVSLHNADNETSDYLLSQGAYQLSTAIPTALDEEGEMPWDETTQGLVLGAFFYGYSLTQIAGGRMAELYGTKIVFGLCILAGGICAILSPVMARAHYGALIGLRVVQGMFQGVSWPSMHACISRWIPPIERPRFIAIVYLASTLSSAMTLPLCGVIIDNHGWASQFYVMGALSLLWCCFWFAFMYDSPDEHPRISDDELKYIQTALRESGTDGNPPRRIPWKEIFTNLPVWAILSACTGNGWGISLLFAQLPTYMKNVLGFSIRSNGALSAVPFLCRYIGGIIWSSLAAWLITREYLSLRTSRRVFGAISLWGPAAMILGVSFAGCDAKLAIILLCLALFLNGATTTSGLVNHTDIAPNFAGTLLGLDNTVGAIIAFVVPIVTGVMTEGQQSLEAWQRVFWICVPMYFFTAIFFLIFVSTDVQPWNDLGHSVKSTTPAPKKDAPSSWGDVSLESR